METKRQDIINEILRLLKMQDIVLVHIAGPTCSKKSTLAKHLSRTVHVGSLALSTDNYFYGMETYRQYIEDMNLDRDQPSAYDLDLCAEHLRDLRKGLGRKVVHPHFFIREKLITTRRTLISKPLIILEGLYSLFPQLAEHADIKIFIDAPLEECRRLRIERSMLQHGVPEEKTAHYFDTVITPAYEKFVVPTKVHADIVLTSVEI